MPDGISAFAILQNTPIWVWFVMVATILPGLNALRDRTVPIWIYWLLPLFGLFSVQTVMASPNLSLMVPIHLVTYVMGCWVGYILQPKWMLAKSSRKVKVKGEWVTLLVLIILFATNYARGVMTAIMPDLVTSLVAAIMFTAVLAFVSGIFLGRSLYVMRAPMKEVSGADSPMAQGVNPV